MPYYKTYKRSYARPVYKKKSYVPKSVKKYVKNSLKEDKENKVRDVNINLDVSSSGQMTLLNGMDEGDSVTEREGLKVKAQSIEWLLTFTNADSPGNLFRMIIFYDNQTNGSTPTNTQLMQSAGSINALVPSMNFQDRFKIVYDTVIDTSNSADDVIVHRRGKRKLSFTQVYISISNAITDMTKNALWVYFQSDSTAITHPNVSGNFRYICKDC